MNADTIKRNRVAELRVAPEIAPTVCCGWDFALKRNPQLSLVYVFCFVSIFIYILYIYYYICIYIYILYNIIKNKKKNPPIGLYTYTEEKNKTQPRLRVAFWLKSALQYAVARILGATRNLKLCNSVAF